MKVTVTVGEASREFEIGEGFSTQANPDPLSRERIAQQSQRNTAVDSLMQAFWESLAEAKGEPAPEWVLPFIPKVSRPSKEEE